MIELEVEANRAGDNRLEGERGGSGLEEGPVIKPLGKVSRRVERTQLAELEGWTENFLRGGSDLNPLIKRFLFDI